MSNDLVKKISVTTGKTILSISLLLNTGWIKKEEPHKFSNTLLEEIVDYQQDYKVILPFKEPQTITEKFVFENNGTITYMNWIRAKNSWKLVRALKNVIDSPGPLGFKRLYDILKKESELTQYVPLEDIAKYNSSKPSFEGTRDPTRPLAKPIFYQKDKLGNLIKIKTTSFKGIILKEENSAINITKEWFSAYNSVNFNKLRQYSSIGLYNMIKEVIRDEGLPTTEDRIKILKILRERKGIKSDEEISYNINLLQQKNLTMISLIGENRKEKSLYHVYLARIDSKWKVYSWDYPRNSLGNCLSNLNNINNIKDTFRSKFGYEDGDAIGTGLASKYINHSIHHLKCEDGGTYTLGKIGESARCSLPEEKHGD
jgi:hypothetical protein